MRLEPTAIFRWTFIFLLILLFAFLVSLKYTHLKGTGEEYSDWTFPEGEEQAEIKNGFLMIPDFGIAEWKLPVLVDSGDLIFELEIKPRWIGQVYFSFGLQETYLGGDLANVIFTRPFTFVLAVKDGKTALAMREDSRVAGPEVPVPNPPSTLTIRSQQSSFAVKSITIRQGENGKVIAKTDFGTDFSPRNIFITTLALFAAFLFCLLFDRLAFYLFYPKNKQGSIAVDFMAAFVPLPVAYLLLSSMMFSQAARPLVMACLLVRIALSVLVISQVSQSRKNHLGLVAALVLSAGLSGALFVFAGRSLGMPVKFGTTAAALLVPACITGFFFPILKRLGQAEEFNPLNLLVRVWIFPAIALLALGKTAIEDFNPSKATVILLATAVCAMIHFFSYRKQLRFYQVFALFLALFAIVALEGSLRYSPYATRLKPLNIGTDFTQDKLLFWAPKDLFDQTQSPQPLGDFEVFSINFRSGETTKKKPAGVYRVLALGGSNTWGQWISSPADVWTGKLQIILSEKLPGRKVEVINSGVKAYNLFQLLVLYKTYLEDYEIDALVLYINLNDRTAASQQGLYTYRELFALRNQGKWDEVLSRAGAKEPEKKSAWIAQWQNRLQQYAVYNGLSRIIIALRSTEAARPLRSELLKSVNPVEDYIENMREFISIAKKKDIPIVFADEFSYFAEGKTDTPDQFSKALKETAMEEGAFYFPAHELLAEHFDNAEIVFPWDTVHLNEKGHAALAKMLADFIVANDLIK